MKHSLSLRTLCEDESEKKQVLKLFAPEDKELSNDRAKYEISEDNLEVIFEIQAKDAVALRAMITSITKTLDVFEHSKQITQG